MATVARRCEGVGAGARRSQVIFLPASGILPPDSSGFVISPFLQNTVCIVHDITEQKRLEEQLEHAAHHDAMTGLLNRRQFYHITEPGQMQHLAIAQDYSLLLIDTDRFKHINDLYGHSKGDEVLCALARTLESCARKGDLVFRWGGEEFVLLLPRTPLDTALSLAETIRVSVAKVSISGLPRFTVSIGVAHHEGNESIDELFKRVDDALYRAKNDGRNRVLAA